MNAQEYAKSLTYPCLFWAGVGCPAGQTIALLEDTELPFSLDEIEGQVVTKDGFACLEADNLADNDGRGNWHFTDWNGSTVYKVQVFDDEKSWTKQHREMCA